MPSPLWSVDGVTVPDVSDTRTDALPYSDGSDEELIYAGVHADVLALDL